MEKHVKWLEVHNYSQYTIGTRRVYIRAFLLWADARGLKYPTQVTKPILEAFQQHLFHYRKAARAAANDELPLVRRQPAPGGR
jgi:integrase/recombinase XerD